MKDLNKYKKQGFEYQTETSEYYILLKKKRISKFWSFFGLLTLPLGIGVFILLAVVLSDSFCTFPLAPVKYSGILCITCNVNAMSKILFGKDTVMSRQKRNVVVLMVTSVLAVVCLTGCQSHTACKAKEAYMYEQVAVWDAASTGMELDKILGIGVDSKGRVYATAGKGENGVLVFDADGKILIADVGHFESEQFTLEIIYELLMKKFPKFAVHFSEVNTNPIKYIK